MKILIIQEAGRHPESSHMRECLSLKHSIQKIGHEAVCWGYGHKSYAKNPDMHMDKSFDVVLCLENYDTGWLPKNLKDTNALKVFWSIDSHCALKQHTDFCRDFSPNIFLSSTSSYLKYYKDISGSQYWFPNAVDTRWFFSKANTEKNKDLIFAASPISDRVDVANLLNKTVDLKFISNTKGQDYVDTLSRAMVSFNKCIADDINYRIFETLACKTALVTNVVPDLDKLFVLDQDLATYSSTKEMIGICQWLKRDEKARKQIAASGYKRVVENHTYDHRANLLCEIIDKHTV